MSHSPLVEALQAIANDCTDWLEEDSDMRADDLLCAIRDHANKVLGEIRGDAPEKIVFGLSQPTKQPSPGAAGAALRALRTVADVIDAGDAESLDSAEGEILDAITLLEGGTVEDVNGPKNPAKVLVEVRGGAVEHSSSGNVDVYVIDYDSEPDAEIPEEFQGL